jgi:hypothetical protein
MRYGYVRVSTIDQDLTLQHNALVAAGCTIIRSEKVTGTSTAGRTELATLLEFIREGDTLIVTRIDRLARSIAQYSQTLASKWTRTGSCALIHVKEAKFGKFQATSQPKVPKDRVITA